MRKLIPSLIAGLILLSGTSLFSEASAQVAAGEKILWQIGRTDQNFKEFALAPDGYRTFKEDGFFIAGSSDPATNWPYVHPGPQDGWAGGHSHTFSILFGVKKTVQSDSCRLRIDLADTHNSLPPELEIRINDNPFKGKLPVGGGDASVNGDASKGKPFTLEFGFSSALIREGVNEVTITTKSGSWFLYDAVSLIAPQTIKSAGILDFFRLASADAGNAVYEKGGRLFRDISLSTVYAGKPFSGNIQSGDKEVLPVTINQGRQYFTIQIPEVAGETEIRIAVHRNDKALDSKIIKIKPVKKMMVYILPHSHTDIGYTEIQTAIEDKQVNNLREGIRYARQTAGYPEGARFVWNVEVGWAADLYLERLGDPEKRDFMDALKSGQVALNGMYLNELTGLCRPEELIRLFRYSTQLEKETGIKIDAAMISDVPGYTWGTVTAMAQAGIRYFSVAPNYFDRIGDILVKWENKPFWWISPSGREKVLVWIPLKGYAMSHIVGKLTPDWVSDYTAQLEKMGYPYDIAHIRWSGHGDNAVPDPAICEFVKEWNTKYAWPRFIISSTSEAFSAFENKYGSQLPEVKGDWTPYWEDGAGSSALETGMNRNTADKLSQAEVLWAMQDPASYPVARFEEAWKKVLLYSEHTWGAWCSITDPENKMTVEQWEIKKGYADEAAKMADELLAEAMKTADRGPQTANDRRPTTDDPRNIQVGIEMEVINTTNWKRNEVVFLSKEQSAAGDIVTDEKGKVLNSQRLNTGELAFLGTEVAPFGVFRFVVKSGMSKPAGSVSIGKNILSNNLIECEIDPGTGDIIRLTDKRTGKNMVDHSDGKALNRYLFFEGNDVSKLQTSGPVNVTVKETGPLVGAVEITSGAPGCNRLTRQLWIAQNADYLVIINIVDKKRAPMPEKIGDWYLAQNKNKESVNFAFPFLVPGGTMRLDLPLGQMVPWIDQIPSACKNWYTAGRWADVSNEESGITWITLDAPLAEVGEISANLVGSQNNPEVWRKTVEPSQTLYSWAMNNHWGTNYRQYQEGPVMFHYIVRPHGKFDASETNNLATGFSQPLLVRPESAKAPLLPFELQGDPVTVITCKPLDSGNGMLVRLFNPMNKSARIGFKTSGANVWISDTGEGKLKKMESFTELAPLGTLTILID